MKKIVVALSAACLLLGTEVVAQTKPPGAMPTGADTTKKAPSKPGVADKVKASKKHAGLFTLYQDTVTGSVQMYVRKDQLNKDFIYQSFSLAGPSSLFLHQSMHRSNLVFKIKKQYDKIEFSMENTSFYADPKNAVSKASDLPEAVFFIDKFSIEDSSGYLISVDGLFLSDKLDPVKPIMSPMLPPGAVFNLGGYNPTKSKYSNIRSYPNNSDVIVDLAYDNPMPFNGGGKDITDARYVRVKLQHSFIEVPVNDFKPRFDDPRIGYFTQEVDDLTSNEITNYRDMINRWHLKKKDPSAALSEPVEPITFWVENTTPVEYRAMVKAAGERWNEAFEKAGFKNAVVMKIMPDDATWDPADIRYNVIRWISSPYPQYGAIGPSFVNPKTGQILGSDISIEWASGAQTPFLDVTETDNAGYSGNDQPMQMVPAHMRKHWANCSIGNELAKQYMAGSTLITTSATDGAADEVRLAHEQFIYYLILHEMGHTLGLNHNMKASQMLSPTEVHNKAITQKLGLQGSVMDYPSININSDRSKQGDYYTMKPGPYDLWAIEYGYREFAAGQEQSSLNTLLRRSHEPYLTFGNDADDMRSPGSGIDPRVMVNDMSNDMVAYGEDRIKFVNSAMSKLVSKYSKGDKSYQEILIRYNVLNGQRFSMANAISRYIGGVQVDRSFPGQNNGSKPFVITPVAYQKKAMSFLATYVFAPNAFEADQQLLPYLQVQRRGFNFFGASEDPKHTSLVQNFQTNILAQLLNPVTLRRINNSALYGNTYSVADVMNDIMNAIFKADAAGAVNVYRQNLQTEFVKGAIAIVEAKTGFDNPSKSAAYNTLRKVRVMLGAAVSPNEQTRAHRSMLSFMIDKALATK
ncbi:MAG: zinc-dependent metalloprotease [Lacibacter sp.]|nr:zinc-dependent metalloprotease [Lacibacter sp.]